jgi:hypothetical protein
MVCYKGFEVLTAVVMRTPVFWHVKLYISLKVSGHLEGTCRIHLLHTRFLLGLFLNPWDLGDMFRRNFIRLLNGLHGVTSQNIELFFPQLNPLHATSQLGLFNVLAVELPQMTALGQCSSLGTAFLQIHGNRCDVQRHGTVHSRKGGHCIPPWF